MQYLANHLLASLSFDSPSMYSYAQFVIPERRLARVGFLMTKFNLHAPEADRECLIKSLLPQLPHLPQLQLVDLDVGAFFLECSNWQVAIFGIGSTRMKNQIVAKTALTFFRWT